MATPKENIINAIKWLIPNLEKKFAPIKHTHTKSDITDFPKIPSSIGDLTTSNISYDSTNDLLKVYTNFETKSNGNSLYVGTGSYKLTSTDKIVLDSPNVTFTGNLVVEKDNYPGCELGVATTASVKSGYIFLYNNKLSDSSMLTTEIYTDANLTQDISLTLPSKSGTFALTSDIPASNTFLRAKTDTDGYCQMLTNKYEDSWVKTPTLGIIPAQKGKLGEGHSNIGTSEWSYAGIFVDSVISKYILSDSYITSKGTLNVEKSDATEAQVNAKNSLINGRFVASSNGRLGIYDGTNSQWILCSEYNKSYVWSAKGIVSTHTNAFRSVYGDRGVILSNDGGYLWLTRTGSGEQYNDPVTDSGYIPFKMHISTSDINFGGRMFNADAIWNQTASGSSNVLIDSNHTLKSIRSAAKYKLDIQNINKGDNYAYNLLKLNPRQWFDKGAIERYNEYLTDLANDEVDLDKSYTYEEDATQLYYGLIAEDLESAGLSEFCNYEKNKDGKKELSSIQYDRIPILTIPILRDLVVCMQKILPTVQEQLDDDTKAEVTTLLNKFNSFDQSEIVNNVYDDSKK